MKKINATVVLTDKAIKGMEQKLESKSQDFHKKGQVSVINSMDNDSIAAVNIRDFDGMTMFDLKRIDDNLYEIKRAAELSGFNHELNAAEVAHIGYFYGVLSNAIQMSLNELY